ncbi:hypothetical protein N0K71_00725 [Dellaglioa algida]|uniref:WxL domain-containing protein n=1 Tax=Dellaglioa algida DSM 15638 TaxID=1423719 RepID=A0A0R1HRR7_9LACO|nr:hypothetical protein [Dellaglioa algida]KRK46129.1 hypothetical protein FC66_GL000630 [Dellaglioa algida DSM 15638]MDK1732138.1 hypothetical protein [Dellaglioa algida]MDK1733664.1 hypothetical protein [Dellaglioa algida]
MRGYNNNKKEWISATLMASAVLAGLLVGGSVTPMTQGEQRVSAQAKEIKAVSSSTSESSKKQTVIKKDDKNVKVVTNKVGSIAPTLGYAGPSTDAVDTNWSKTPVDPNKITTTYVSPSGKQYIDDEPVLYFGNNELKFQPSSLTNNKSYNDPTNASSWMYTGTTGVNPNPRRSYGIIINGNVPDDRGYGNTSSARTNSIEAGVRDGKITNYQLYKNTSGTGFKATMYDTVYNLSYTFEEIYDEVGGIYSYFSITNNDAAGTASRAVGAVQGVDTFVDSDRVPVKSIGPNAGFKMTGDKHTLNFRLNSPVNNARLGGWTNYTAGRVPGVMQIANVSEYFTGGILGAGMEASAADKVISISDISKPDEPLIDDSGFVIKTNPKMLAPGETLTNGSYLTYKEVTPSTPPVATVTTPTINAYADQAAAFTIKGKVIDVDGTKGHIEITYPDGSTSPATDNKYDTSKINTFFDYTAKIDPARLSVGANTITIAAVDDKDNRQLLPVTMKANLFKLSATGLPQLIKIGGTVSTLETDLIKNLTIMNKNKHTLTIDGKNPSGKPLDNSKVGFYFQDMTLTDTDTSPVEVANVPVPVNVSDDHTVIDTTSAVYAKDFSTTSEAISGLSNADLNALILKSSEARGWMSATGAESKVSVKSTTLTGTSSDGVYKAVIQNANGKEITINITVTGGLKIASAPDAITYGASTGVMLPYSKENFNLQRQDNSTAKVSISNSGKQAWKLTAKVSKPLTSGSDTLTGVLKYIDTNNAVTDLDSGSVIVGTGKTEATQDVTWDAKQGIIASLDGANTSLKAGKYTGELTWTLDDTPNA